MLVAPRGSWCSNRKLRALHKLRIFGVEKTGVARLCQESLLLLFLTSFRITLVSKKKSSMTIYYTLTFGILVTEASAVLYAYSRATRYSPCLGLMFIADDNLRYSRGK